MLSLFLDFDGTLTPIVRDPSAAQLDDRARNTLAGILGNKGMMISVISGRALDDVRARVGLDGIIYAGNHGLEIRGPDFQFVEPAALSIQDQIRQVSIHLAKALEAVPRAEVEYKKLTATVHYRRVANRDVSTIRALIDRTIAHAETLRVRSGKRVFEVLPRTSWNKGSAVRWINDRIGIPGDSSIYIGDDRTDEDAFQALADGITVKVGKTAKTHAKYFLDNPGEVLALLLWLADFQKSHKVSASQKSGG